MLHRIIKHSKLSIEIKNVSVPNNRNNGYESEQKIYILKIFKPYYDKSTYYHINSCLKFVAFETYVLKDYIMITEIHNHVNIILISFEKDVGLLYVGGGFM